MWEAFVINCVSEMKSNTSTCSVSILPLNNISWYVDFTIGTNLVDIQVLSWSICFYRLAMLRAAILNLLVLGIRKLGWLLIRFQAQGSLSVEMLASSIFIWVIG